MFCGHFDLFSKTFYVLRIIKIQFEVLNWFENRFSEEIDIFKHNFIILNFQRNAKTGYSNDDRLDLLMKKADLGDWFLIFLLSKNLDSILFREFISQLTEKLKTEP